MKKYFLFLLLPILFPCKASAKNISVSFESYDMPGWYIAVKNENVTLLPLSTEMDKEYTTFIIVPGLAQSNYTSIQSATDRNFYLRHRNGVIILREYSTWHSYRRDATFKKEPGIADKNNNDLVSFRVYSHPGMFIRYKHGKFYIEEPDESEIFKKNATFIIRPPNWDGKIKLTEKRTGEKSFTNSSEAAFAAFLYYIGLVMITLVIIIIIKIRKKRILQGTVKKQLKQL
ncbi:MAG: AbfB domain-containing protein [Spirochaetales bacterium]|nr:AbfB domain-containing protein [Spirochaetales bacterium]